VIERYIPPSPNAGEKHRQGDGFGEFDVLRRLFDQDRFFHNRLTSLLISGRRLCPVCERVGHVVVRCI